MEIILIAAVARNSVIGKDGNIPWDIPEDMERFKELTLGHSVIMGRKTFENCGVLEGRKNIVLSRTLKEVEGATVIDELDRALTLCEGEDKVFIIGGGSVYKEAIRKAHKLFITHVDKEIEGDAFFPEFSKSDWNQVSHEFGDGCIFTEYVRE